jgi:hypothetical protein
MADFSIKQIQDILPGDYVLGADKFGNTFPVKVLNVFENGVRECSEYKFRQGRSNRILSVVATPEHKISTSMRRFTGRTSPFEWIDSIQPIGTATSYPFCAKLAGGLASDLHLKYEPFALILGLVLGDGCFTKSVSMPELACCDDLLIDDIKLYVESLNLKLTRCDLKYRIAALKKQKGISHSNGGRRAVNPLKQFLTSLGLWGLYCHEKFIPDVVHTWNNKAVSELIAGLFATDGCVHKTGRNGMAFMIAMTSKQIIESLQSLLALRFGIYAAITVVPPETRSGAKLVLYRLNISSWDAVQKFCEVIHIPGVKRLKVSKWRYHAPSKQDSNCRRANRVSTSLIGFENTFDIEVDHPDHLFGICKKCS